jgi:hypothetical protein
MEKRNQPGHAAPQRSACATSASGRRVKGPNLSSGLTDVVLDDDRAEPESTGRRRSDRAA